MSLSRCGAFLLPIAFGCVYAIHAHAALLVTEIMYNPIGANTGHQWVEITNTGNELVDLSGKEVRFFDASGNHLLKQYGAGNLLMVPGSVSIVAQNPVTFLSDFPSYAGTLIKSSFTLTAEGLVGIALTDGTVLTKSSYDSRLGALGDGNSLQHIQNKPSGILQPGTPTPGIYPVTAPKILIPPVKLSAPKLSTNKRAGLSARTSSSNSSSKNNYGKGTLAPPASANTEAGGALSGFGFPSLHLPAL